MLLWVARGMLKELPDASGSVSFQFSWSSRRGFGSFSAVSCQVVGGVCVPGRPDDSEQAAGDDADRVFFWRAPRARALRYHCAARAEERRKLSAKSAIATRAGLLAT